MKWLCIFLLLANIGFFGWHLDQQSQTSTAQAASAPPVIAQSAQRLQLLTELEQQPEPHAPIAEDIEQPTAELESSPSPTAEQGAGPLGQQIQLEQMDIIKQLSASQFADETEVCVSYGPINGQSMTERLAAWLQSKNVRFHQRLSVDEETELFWVYLSAQSDLDTARQVVDDLKNKGVTDYQLIRSGKFKNAISLGLFSSKDRVNKRLQEINAKGYKPVVVPYHKPDMKNIFWVDALFDTTRDDFAQTISAVPTGFDSRPIACSEIALASQNP